ncbi:MFS transporter [Pseudomonas sp. JZ134]|uniref:MFS transporter n=1 Tax=Pseudomonas sp. JZ134 TaxID=2806615 RepID=UPI003DA05B41
MNTDTNVSTCTAARPRQERLSRLLVVLLSCTAGASVANVYMAQPLLDAMAQDLGVGAAHIGLVVTATQIGYALGLFFLVPLGDLINRRRLILVQILLSACFLLLASVADRFLALLASLAAVGLMATVVQVVVAFAATLARPEERGSVVGRVTSGIVLGILLARLFSGLMSDLAGWRSVYMISAALAVVLAGALALMLPRHNRDARPVSYLSLLCSVPRLFMSEPVLRVRAVLAMLIFAAFSILWTALVLPLSEPEMGLTQTQIGLFGLAGVAGALAAARAGKRADAGKGQQTTGIALLLLLLSWAPIAGLHASIAVLVLGVIILDFAVQAVHVTNQSLILAARPDASSRLVGGYMTFYSIGSAAGAFASTAAYGWAGWNGVCVLGAAVSLSALLFWYLTRPR